MENKNHIITYNKENGNIIFSYRIIKMQDTIMHFIVPLAVFLTLVIIELSYFQSFYSIALIILLLYFLDRWVTITDNKNLSIEEKAVYNCLDVVIPNDILSKFEEDIKEIERRYIYRRLEDHKEERFVSVLLSNGKELKYNIINPKWYNKNLSLEINVNPEIVD